MKKLLFCCALLIGLAGCEDECDLDPLAPGCSESTRLPQAFGTGMQAASAADLLGVPLAIAPFSGGSLPRTYDLSADFPPAGAQGSQNSCVGWAVAYGLKSFHERQEERWSLTSGGQPIAERVFSPAFVYNQINRGVDAGSTFPDALELLRRSGVAPMSYMPYDAGDYRRQPLPPAWSAASPYRIASWRRLDAGNLAEIKAQIVAGFPVLTGIFVDGSFERLRAGQVWTRTDGSTGGGHAMVIVGYDDNRSAFKVLNSWGEGWSDRGYGWIGYNHFLSLRPEVYVTRDLPNGTTPATNPPAPTLHVDPADASQVAVHSVTHNVFVPNLGYVMRFDGTVAIPPGAGSEVQVVVLFYANTGGGKGAAVQALVPAFAMPSGQAATGAPRIPLPMQGLQTTWYAFMPYTVLNVPRGAPVTLIQSDLVAEPVLYVNGFGIKRAPLIPFFVRL